MQFANLQYSYSFFIVLVLFAVYIFALRRKSRLLSRFAENSLIRKLVSSYSQRKEKLRIGIMITAVVLLCVALIRPQWGFVWEEVEHRGVDFFVAVDVSKSMLTRDVLPSRLERAKLALEDLVEELGGDRIGLIAFAGSAFVQCPLTIDYSGFLLAVKDLNTETIPDPGTNLESAIEEALKSFKQGSEGANRALIIITDGESHIGNAQKAAEEAARQKIKIYCIGVGTREGELILSKDKAGNITYLKDSKGQVIKSRLNEKLLEEVAFKSGGTYVKSTPTDFGLELVYNKKINSMEKKKLKSAIEKRPLERFQLPLGLAVLLLFIEPFITNRKKDETN